MKKQFVVSSALTKEQWTQIDNAFLELARSRDGGTDSRLPTAKEFAANFPGNAQRFLDATSVDAVTFARALEYGL